MLGDLKKLGWAWQAGRALRYAKAKGLVGADFGEYGRSLGWRLLAKGSRGGLDWLCNPVDSVRYF